MVTKKRNTILVILLIFIGILLGLSSLSRPSVVPADGSLSEFSAERALSDISVIAENPHPAGSGEIKVVRDYIISRLKGMGLRTDVQVTHVSVPGRTSVIATTVENIIAVIPGHNSSKSIVLDAHYDTRAMTPGASDCSSAVAILLETARALSEESPLQNDIILVFTDNEEYGGGLGAKGFLDNYPHAEEIGMVVNFE